MDQRLIELHVQRGRLHERIGAQRAQLARELAPLTNTLHAIDRAQARYYRVRAWMAEHPVAVAAIVVALVVWRPGAVVRSLRWGLSAWRRGLRVRNWII
jgi:hypothetical protein